MSSAQASPSLHATSQTWREILTWILLGLAVTELFAFWMVCTQQVREADIRRVELEVQQMAMADCLQYVPGSTIGSCASPMEGPTRKAAVRSPSDQGRRPTGPVASAAVGARQR